MILIIQSKRMWVTWCGDTTQINCHIQIEINNNYRTNARQIEKST